VALSNLASRVLTAVVALPPLVLLVLWDVRPAFGALVMVCAGVGLFEYTGMLLGGMTRLGRMLVGAGSRCPRRGRERRGGDGWTGSRRRRRGRGGRRGCGRRRVRCGGLRLALLERLHLGDEPLHLTPLGSRHARLA
jgi:hypothetical protein